MRTMRRFVIALALLATLGVPAFADRAKPRDRSDRDSAERRHPRPRQNREREYRPRDHRPQRHYRPYRPYYRYERPYRHYRSPRYTFTCRVWFRGYWDYDQYGEFWVPGHYGYVLCR